MEFAIFVWLASVIPTIKSFLGFPVLLIVLYCGAKIVFAMFNSDTGYTRKYEPEHYKKAMEVWKFKWAKYPVAIIVLLLTVSSLLPSQKTMYLMAAAYGSQKVVQSETAEKAVKIINSKLDEYLKEAEEKLSSKEKK